MRHVLTGCVIGWGVAVCLGCGSSNGRIKGQIVENGQPVEIDGQAALMFYLLDSSGRPDPAHSYPMPLLKDGSFELVASGGEVPPGKYMVTFDVNAPPSETGLGRFRGRFAYPDSPLRQEIKAGTNQVTIDVAKSGA
jgi:hypothetical protein